MGEPTLRRVSGIDAAFLYGETPSWHMHVSAVLVVDPNGVPGGFDAELFKRILERRLHRAPQFRWKLQHVPFGLDRPHLVEDEVFDIDFHVRRIGCPSPGGPAELGSLIGTLIGLKIDRTRPLWEIWVIEGLQGGEVALLAKIHHSIIDGVAGAEVAMLLFDLTPEPEFDEVAPDEAVPVPSGGLGAGELLTQGARAVIQAPGRLLSLAGSLARQGRTLLGHLSGPEPPALPFAAPMTLLNGQLTPQRRFDSTSLPLDEIKAVKERHGVTVNDVILAVCAGALRRWLLTHDALPEVPLIAQVPVSTRDAGYRQGDGTKVSNMSVPLRTDVHDPARRLHSIHVAAQNAKALRRALSGSKTVDITDAVSPALVNLAARTYTAVQLEDRGAPFNLIISNIPGPPEALYVAGARLASVYPMGPLLIGGGLNVTVMSYCGYVDFGLLSCPEVVPDAWRIADAIPFALKELVDSAPV